MRRAVAIVAAVLVVHTMAKADPLQDQVLAGMRATHTDDLAFTMTTRAEQTGSTAQAIVLHYDPRSGKDGWTVTSIDGRAPTAREQKDVRQGSRPRPCLCPPR